MNEWLNSGGDPDHGSESVSRVFATLVRRALAEVCTVLVLLVNNETVIDNVSRFPYNMYVSPEMKEAYTPYIK